MRSPRPIRLTEVLMACWVRWQIVEPNGENSRTANIVQTMENVSNFLTALEGLSFPKNSTFSIADIDSNTWEER